MVCDLDEDQKMLYLDTLREGVTPFDRFVSRSDMKDIVDVPEPRKLIDTTIRKLLKLVANDHTTRFLPIVGAAGTGKTHLYWAIKEQKEAFDCYIIYIPSPPAPVRMLFHIYSCLMNELGDILLKKVGTSIVQDYGGSHRSLDPLGVFKFKRSSQELQRMARKDFAGLQSEFVRTLITYHMKGLHWQLSERWLLGEALSESELNKLSVSRVIEEDDMTMAALKVICSLSDRPIIFYFDELEIPYNSYGPEAEIRLLSMQKRIYNEVSNVLIIVACLSDIWPRITQITDSAMRSRMEMELELKPFTLDDTKKLYIHALERFWDENNLSAPSDPYFPLNENIFHVVFQKTKGNPRDTIKMIKVFMDQILTDKELFEHLQEKIEFIEKTRTETAPIPVSAQQVEPQPHEELPVPTATDLGAKFVSNLDKIIDAAVKKKEEEFEAELASDIEVTPSSIVSAAIDSLLTFAKEKKVEIKVNFDYEFTVAGKKKSISAYLLDPQGAKIGFDIPTIKTFDKSGGVAAFYAIERLKNALNEGIIDHSCLIVPRDTAGKKYALTCEEIGSKLTIVELNDAEAKELIRGAKSNPSIKGREFARIVFSNLPLEPPAPMPPKES